MRCGLPHLRSMYTMHNSLHRSGAPAACQFGVPLDVIGAFGGWAVLGRMFVRAAGALPQSQGPGSPKPLAFFGTLTARRVAPMSGQYFNR
jgi:hypothetical protein